MVERSRNHYLHPSVALESLISALRRGLLAQSISLSEYISVTNSQGEVCAQAVVAFAVSYPEET
jgi:uncharacterized membrane protein YdbT with pleckstrin-like domain